LFFRKIFKKTQGEKKTLINVHSKWTITYSGEPLLLEAKPNLSEIFSKDVPDIPEKVTDKNRKYYEQMSPDSRRTILAAAYLNHPDPAIRLEAVEFAKKHYALVTQQHLVDLLADSSKEVREVAAKAIWEKNAVEFAIRALGDEHDAPSHMSRSEALSAVQILKDAYPKRSEDFKKWYEKNWHR